MPPLKVEYAKSARSRCCLKECSKFIQKGELRVGTGVLMPGMDEPSFKWRHVCCFTARQVKNAGGSVDNIDGYEALTEADQAVIQDMMKGKLVNNQSLIGRVSGPVGAEGQHSDGEKDDDSPKVAKKQQKKAKVAAAVAPLSHPIDVDSDATDDYNLEEESSTVGSSTGQPACPYGSSCFRKNPEHFAQYRHPSVDQEATSHPPLHTSSKLHVVVRATLHTKETAATSPPVTAAVAKVVANPFIPAPAPLQGEGKKVCPNGVLCFRTDPKHFSDFSH